MYDLTNTFLIIKIVYVTIYRFKKFSNINKVIPKNWLIKNMMQKHLVFEISVFLCCSK